MNSFSELLLFIGKDCLTIIFDYLYEEYGWELAHHLVKHNVSYWQCLVYNNLKNSLEYKKIYSFSDCKKAYNDYPNMPIYRQPYIVVQRYDKFEYNYVYYWYCNRFNKLWMEKVPIYKQSITVKQHDNNKRNKYYYDKRNKYNKYMQHEYYNYSRN